MQLEACSRCVQQDALQPRLAVWQRQAGQLCTGGKAGQPGIELIQVAICQLLIGSKTR